MVKPESIEMRHKRHLGHPGTPCIFTYIHAFMAQYLLVVP